MYMKNVSMGNDENAYTFLIPTCLGREYSAFCSWKRNLFHEWDRMFSLYFHKWNKFHFQVQNVDISHCRGYANMLFCCYFHTVKYHLFILLTNLMAIPYDNYFNE